MNARAACWVALAALAGCAAVPTAKDVPTADYMNYWTMRADSLPQSPAIPQEDGCMRVQVVIDSQGRIADSKVLAVVGPHLSAWIPTLLAGLRYDPAPGNPARTPIRTVLHWTFNYSNLTGTGTGATSEAAIKAKLAAGPPPETDEWRVHCDAEMDEQMGITSAPAAATVSQR